MKRGDVFDVRFGRTEGHEQAGTRPAVVVSRDAINAVSEVVVAVPCTTLRPGRRLYPSNILLRAPEGGLDVDSVALCGQVRALAVSRFGRQRGSLSDRTMRQIDRALVIVLDLDRP